MNEAQLVARVRELFSSRIGDDAAVVDGQVLTADLLIENVDFTRAVPLRFVARKSLAVNLSDLAAMGAEPSRALLSLALPPWALENVDEMLVAYSEAAREYRIEIVGGDFSRAEKLTIAITAIGRIVTRPLLRSGARPGDRIYLSRPVGGSAAGLAFLERDQSAMSYAERELVQSAVRRHIDPEPEIALGMALAAIEQVTSCIDVSDGLSTDLHHLCAASDCGAEVERQRIPVFADLPSLGAGLGISVRDAVLHGGEEFALLFTSTLRESELSRMVGRPVYAIGRMLAGSGVVLEENGVKVPLAPGGFDHFA
jgi:thiamine-monophosphate kinase